MTKIVQCKYCGEDKDTRGLLSHIHFKHVRQVIEELYLNPWVQLFTYGEIRGFRQLQLPAKSTEGIVQEMLPYSKIQRWI